MADTGSYECDLSNGDSMVIDVYLVEKHSDSDCTFFNGPLSNAPPGGGWKKQGNSIFVVEGCRGTFQYCTTGLFACFDSLRPSQHYSVMSGRVEKIKCPAQGSTTVTLDSV